MSVRVRFAPSPTGSLHIGSIRTALYNYAFAKKHNGQLLLRIEDTDRVRFDAESVVSILEDLIWMGLQWDDGPFYQSERLRLYREAAEQLVTDGAAYYCFCPRGQSDDGCRWFLPDKARERADREPHVIRLKVPQVGVDIHLDDLIYGRVSWPLRTIDDQVLLKSDGFPTYHLAVVVDDHDMGITHVFRGEDWLPSTPKHLLLYDALGLVPPAFGHLPNVLGAAGVKLAKRYGTTSVTEFRDSGYLPEALTNYVALIGWATKTTDEVLSLTEITERFDIAGIQRAGGRWDQDRLDWFNGVWIRRLSPNEFRYRAGFYLPPGWDRSVVAKVLPLMQPRIKTLTELRPQIAFLFEPVEVTPTHPAHPMRDILEDLAWLFSHTADLFDAAHIKKYVEHVSVASGVKIRPLTMAIRVAVTGATVGPPLYESLELLGVDKTVMRLRGHAI